MKITDIITDIGDLSPILPPTLSVISPILDIGDITDKYRCFSEGMNRSVFLVDPSGVAIYNDSLIIKITYVDCGRCLRRKVKAQEVSGRAR